MQCIMPPYECNVTCISTGIATIVLPEDIYNAFDEYFSLEKTASESTIAEGTTNKDKIINHGFDTKTSFRGKP